MTNVAIVGLGKMGLSHLAIANALDGFNVIAIVDPAPLVGSTIARYGNFRHLESFADLLNVGEVQAVIIATPSRSHELMIRSSFDRGWDVFCEKPLTLSAEASEELAGMAAAKELVTQVGYHNRYIGTFYEVKRLLGQGALGRITHAHAEAYGPVVLRPSKSTWRSSAAEGGGCLYDYAAHPLNLLNWYFGRPKAVAGSQLKSMFSAEVDDEVYSTLHFGAGITGQLSVNWSDESVRKMSTKISIWGEHGKIVVDRQELQVYLRNGAAAPERYHHGWNTHYITDLTDPVSFYLRGEEYSAQLEAFAVAVRARSKTRSDFHSAADTDRSLAMIRADAQGEEVGAGFRTSGVAAAPKKSFFSFRRAGMRG
jgi:scyllo-inositol 2-dehydrogenase (NADP+)